MAPAGKTGVVMKKNSAPSPPSTMCGMRAASGRDRMTGGEAERMAGMGTLGAMVATETDAAMAGTAAVIHTSKAWSAFS